MKEEDENRSISCYVGFASTSRNVQDIVSAAAERTNLTWTISETAIPGDLVVFYATEPVYSFIAYGRVLQDVAEKCRGKHQAEIFNVKLLPEPVTLQRAKERLGMRWLDTAKGFGRGRKENLKLITTLGGV